MSEQPLVSVITPARNAERYIGSCLDGVRNQTWDNVEHVVVDDGSTDATPAILAAHADHVRVVTSTGEGVSAARNRGVAAASGEWIALCDADDVLLPRHLEAAMALLTDATRRGNPRSFVTCEAYLLTRGGIDPARRVLPWGAVPPQRQRLGILEMNFVSIFTVMPRALWDEMGGMSTALRYNEDWKLWMDAIHAGWTVLTQTDPQALYRWTPGSAMTNVEAVLEAEERMVDEFVSTHRDGLRPEERAYLAERERTGNPRVMGRHADNALRAGDFTTARTQFQQAARLMPHDRRMRAKALTMRLTPAAGHFWQRRLLAADRATGRDTDQR